MDRVTPDGIRAAARRIRPHVILTPVLASDGLASPGLYLKAENLQRTGSFKVRGALNAVLQLTPAQRARGVITLSAGNHGQALAYAARTVGIPCVVVIREDAAGVKVDAIRRFGAEVVFTPVDRWQRCLEEEQERRDLWLVHPFDDPAVLAGQGTVGLEILQSVSDVTTLVVPVGGGGLIAGVARAVKAARPDTRVVGVEPTGASVVSASLKAGRPVTLDRMDTIADGLAAPYTRALALDLIQRYVDDVVCVSDDQLIESLRALAINAKLVVEPAGAAAVAAVRSGLHHPTRPGPTVAILSGGNVDPDRLAGWLRSA